MTEKDKLFRALRYLVYGVAALIALLVGPVVFLLLGLTLGALTGGW